MKRVLITKERMIFVLRFSFSFESSFLLICSLLSWRSLSFSSSTSYVIDLSSVFISKQVDCDINSSIVDEVIDGPQSVVYQEAENRIHTAKAVMSLFVHDKLPGDRR